MIALYSTTGFLSAFLLFLVQPMVGKLLLPQLGGAPAVWNTAMMFFQTLLLLGYLYAHLSLRIIDARRQSFVHVAVLAATLLALPIGAAANLQPPVDDYPVLWLTATLFATVGIPFFALSAMSPLLQAWFSHTDHRLSQNPYFLYAASNLGSFTALLAYPLLVERNFELSDQTRIWGFGFAALVLFAALCIPAIRPVGRPADSPTSDGQPHEPITSRRRIRWVLLAFAPSTLLLGVTTHLTTNIAPVPLLWVLPLALYLLTFVIAFANRQIFSLEFAANFQFALVLLLILIGAFDWPLTRIHFDPAGSSRSYLIHLGAFFVFAMVCHLRLAHDRPSPKHLTEFFLWLSFGGMLGGVFNALVAPVIFDDMFEYPLALILACALRPSTSRAVDPDLATENWMRQPWLRDLLLPAGLLALLLTLRIAYTHRWFGLETIWNLRDGWALAFIVIYSALIIALFRTAANRPIRFALIVAACICSSTIAFRDQTAATGMHVEVLEQTRNFYGVLKAEEYASLDGEGYVVRKLAHGITNHGSQITDPRYQHLPVAYYHPNGPLGDIFRELETAQTRPVGIIGLGIGTIACYGKSGQPFDYFEINPAVARIAEDASLFTYLSVCKARTRIAIGDGRLEIAKTPKQRYGLIIIDAFSSDAIPTHLLTREAIELYFEHLAPGGALAFHISSNYVDLAPVLGNLARDLQIASVHRAARKPSSELAVEELNSYWAVLARKPADLTALERSPGWGTLATDPTLPIWTDEYSDLLSVLRF